MKFLKTLCLATALILTISASHAREAVPIVNYDAIAINTATGKTLTQADVKAAIIRAGSSQGWVMSDIAQDQLTGTLQVRGKHTVVVTIRFSADKFSVAYKDSIDMKYAVFEGVPLIHPFYNKWVQTLINNIRIETQKL
ncbi:MAG TPA: hypothetical protein PLW86_01870 [Rhodocyclaceae bacterium]|nr:hypothetical protein [Rhodocyclaceae bacterium]